jgi:hypothetical protein
MSLTITDINGDGCDDYLVVEESGRVTAYFNLGPGNFPVWSRSFVVAEGVGAFRAEIRFAGTLPQLFSFVL